MKVAAFIKFKSDHHVEVANSFKAGLKRHGLTMDIRDVFDKQPYPCDLALVRGIKGNNSFFRRQQAKNGKNYLTMESGFFNSRVNWVSFGFNGLNGRADFVNKECPPDLWNKHHKHLMKPWKEEEGKYILITGQMATDASVYQAHWVHKDLSLTYMLRTNSGRHPIVPDYQAIVDEIKRHTDLPVKFRPHPASLDPRMKRRQYAPPSGTAVTKGEWKDLKAEIRGAHCVVTFNSTTCLDAILNGTPCIVLDEGAMAWDVCGHTLSEVNNPPRPDRTQWAYDLAYTQWTYDEVKSGEAWDHLKHFYD